MSHSNTLSVGEGYINGMDANDKANYSMNNLNGNENQIKNNVNVINDQDVIDGIMEDQDIKITNIKKD